MEEQEPESTAQETIEDAPEKPDLAPIKEIVSLDDFDPLDLRVGTVLEAEIVEGADKLLRLTIDIGIEVRQVVSGIRAQYSPEDLIGSQVVLFANLKPRKIRGTISQGMVLAADHDGIPTLLTPNRGATNGAIIR